MNVTLDPSTGGHVCVVGGGVVMEQTRLDAAAAAAILKRPFATGCGVCDVSLANKRASRGHGQLHGIRLPGRR